MNGAVPLSVPVLFGPTAVGKTAVAGKLFTGGGPFSGRAEVISADSMQVYRGMDIGTATPDASFLQELPHHCINIRNPDQQFGAGEFVREADRACVDIASRGKIPVILGGTGFYIRNFLLGMPETPPADIDVREALQRRLAEEGPEKLIDELKKVDPVSAARIHSNDHYRILRALEVYTVSSRPLSSYELSQSFRPGYRFLVLVLDRDRKELYSRIEQRVQEMFQAGLREEFLSLLEAGYTRDDPGMQAIGYREFFSFDPPGSRVEDVEKLVCHATKRYAKRQETYIRSIPGIQRVGAGVYREIENLLTQFLKNG